MSNANVESDFLYIATCMRHHVTALGNKNATMMNLKLYKTMYGLTLLQTRVVWNNIITSEQMVDRYEKNIYYGHYVF